MELAWSIERATWPLLCLALATMIAHAFTGAGFGFHGDELQFMDDARHLAWGYVAYPTMTPFFARLSLGLFGTSIAGFRFFASLAHAVAIILTGLMAREMGGGARAQVLAGAALVPYALAAGALMIYNSFDKKIAERVAAAGYTPARIVDGTNFVKDPDGYTIDRQ
jgi:hypothetical protein